MDKVEIVPMSAEHVGQIALLEKLSSSMPWSENSLAQELDNSDAHFLVALCGGEVAGYVGALEAADGCDIVNVAVFPDFRRRSLATVLLEEAHRAAKKRGCVSATLEVRPSNTAALALYQKLGYSAVGRRKNFYQNPVEDALIMSKNFSEGTVTE